MELNYYVVKNDTDNFLTFNEGDSLFNVVALKNGDMCCFYCNAVDKMEAIDKTINFCKSNDNIYIYDLEEAQKTFKTLFGTFLPNNASVEPFKFATTGLSCGEDNDCLIYLHSVEELEEFPEFMQVSADVFLEYIYEMFNCDYSTKAFLSNILEYTNTFKSSYEKLKFFKKMIEGTGITLSNLELSICEIFTIL